MGEVVTLIVGSTFANGVVVAVDGENITVRNPESTDVVWDYGWAHIVHRKKIVATWSTGEWCDW